MRINGQYGFNLVGVIVAAGVGVIVMAALALQIVSSSREIHYLEAKVESLRLIQELTLLMTGGSGINCESTFIGKTIGFANTATDQTIDITSIIPGTPLGTLIDSYSTSNRLINVTSVRLFHPAYKLGNTSNPNTTSPYEFKLRLVAQEKSNNGRTINVDGPTVNLNISSGTTVDSPGACWGGSSSSASNSLKMFTGTGCASCPYGASVLKTVGVISFYYCDLKDVYGNKVTVANDSNYCSCSGFAGCTSFPFLFPSY